MNDEKDEKEYGFSLPGLLRVAFGVAAADAAAPVKVAGADRGQWGPAPRGSAEPPSPVAAGQPWPESVAVRAPAPPPVLPRWTASHAGRDAALKLRVLAAEPREDARPRGIAIHKLFEQIEWLEDFRATDADLLAVLRDLDDPPSEALARGWIAEFRVMLARSHVCGPLTRPAGVPPDRLTVWRERRFALSLPEPGRSEPAILRGSFDRVVLVGPLGAPESATILDFKTGAVADAEAERAKREQYAPQMEVYRGALAKMRGLNTARILPDLCFVDADE